MFYNWKRLTLAVGFIVLATPAGLSADNTEIDKKHDNSVKIQSEKQDEDIRSILIALESAISAGNAEKAAALWSEDAIFIDEAGEETHGHKALQERFSTLFKEETTSRAIGLHPERISCPADNIGLVVGVVSRKVGQADLPASKFSMVLIKKESGWLINEATETAMQSISSGEHLKELNWLIGNWQVKKAEGSANLNVDWAPGKNFIVSKFVINKKNEAEQIDNQVIGWDPRSNSVVSWHFDCNGGFAYGKWSKESDQWMVDVAGVGADGSSTRATNVFTLKKADEFIWQSIHRNSNGTPVADTEALTVLKATR